MFYAACCMPHVVSCGGLAYTRPHVLDGFGDRFHIKHDFHQGDVFFVGFRSNLRFHRRFRDVVHRQVQVDTRQGASPRRIAFGDCQGVKTAALGIGRPEQDDDLCTTVAFGYALDFILTFQVKSPCSRSHEAVGHLQHHLRPGTDGTLGNGMPLHAIPFTKSNHLFPLQIHAVLLVQVSRLPS